MSKEKTYYNVIELSEAFQAALHAGGQMPVAEMHFWQIRFTLAIAQQLTMIAQHLGKIVANAAKVE